MISRLMNRRVLTLDETINEEIVMLERVGLNCGGSRSQRNANCKH